MTAEPGLTSITQTHYEQIARRYVRGCGDGAHRARGTTDREGRRVFVCDRCPAWRYGDDPTWRQI